MPFMTTPELLSQRRYTQDDIHRLQRLMPELQGDNRERAVNTIANLRGQLETISAELAMANAS